ncbi:hypothetical protein N657DRAFT_657438 [Parathielavia appendiculata]|uniref:Uncharacterized protein n=1 Tax=Parathielavia appendiculata TaxID=2587402 RepID=A0AAN6TW92_9PEZI|nr:hypothetical protein N657DRAFT_657438 [Parathielavia appendiculata]
MTLKCQFCAAALPAHFLAEYGDRHSGHYPDGGTSRVPTLPRPRNPQGAGDARPTALQIIQDEGVQGKLAGKVIVIAGATSGIGVETARALKATGATLLLTDAQPGQGPEEPCRHSRARPRLPRRDGLDSFRSIRAGPLNILINSVGLLKPALLASVTVDLDFHSRVVVVSSSAHRACTLPASDNYSFEQGGYNPKTAYNNAQAGGGVLKSPEQGAATTVWAALEDVAEAERAENDGQVFGEKDRLWRDSLKMVGLEGEA